MKLHKPFISTIILLGLFAGNPSVVHGQEIYNQGNFYVAPGGFVGIHGDLENQGSLVSEGQKFGFYGDQEILVSGNSPIEAENVEIFKSGGVFLRNSILISGECFFVEGNFDGILSDQEHGLIYREFATSFGASADSKSTTWTSALGKNQFVLPTGSRERYRPLTYRSEDPLAEVKAAYLPENPNFPTSISETFPTEARDSELQAVSSSEFWLIQSSGILSLSLGWDAQSNLTALAGELGQITLAGWNRRRGLWVPIITSVRNGTLEEGSLGTIIFNASDYAAITFGTLNANFEAEDLDNRGYFVSPNGDGINDALVLEHLELGGKSNVIHIFNRSGQKVFEFANYYDQFTGFANNGSLIVGGSSRLPTGVYYYIVDLLEEGLTYQGYFILED